MARECIKVQLKSSDGEMFEVDEVVAMESVTLKHMIQDTGNVSVIPLPNVTANILSRVIQYCQYHLVAAKTCEGNAAVNSEDVKKLDEEFVKVDLSTLFDLILAANYLDIKELLDLTCQAVADMIAGKSPEEIRKIFNIRNDFTAEEEAEIRRENQWAFEEI